MHHREVWIIIAAALLFGCSITGSGHEGSGAAEAEGATQTGGAGAEGATQTGGAGAEMARGGAPPSSDCTAACSEPVDTLCLSSQKCEEHCQANAAGWPEVVFNAFEQCVTTEPLCFLTIEDCMWSKLYPEPIAFELVVTGSGFGAYEEKPVTVGVAPYNEFETIVHTTVKDGAFSLSIDVAACITCSQLVMVWIDDVLDGVCDEDDFVASSFVSVVGDWLSPSYPELHFDPSFIQSPFLCNYLP